MSEITEELITIYGLWGGGMEGGDGRGREGGREEDMGIGKGKNKRGRDRE